MVKLSGKDISELRSQAQTLDASLQMGKAGLTDAFVDEVKHHLGQEDLIKIKLLRSARAGEDRKDLAEELAEAADAVLVEVKGYTVVLYKP